MTQNLICQNCLEGRYNYNRDMDYLFLNNKGVCNDCGDDKQCFDIHPSRLQLKKNARKIETGMGNKLKIAIHKFITDVGRITTEPLDADDTESIVLFLENELDHSQGNLTHSEYSETHEALDFDERFSYSERRG